MDKRRTNPPAKSFCSVRDASEALSLVSSHNAAKSIDLLVPTEELAKIETDLNNLPPLYTYRLRCGLGALLDPEFLQLSRSVTSIVLSNTRIDHEDVFAIVNQHLILSLTGQTYQKAGLEGSPSKLSHDRYIITYDLQDKSASPGHARYDRLLWATENTLTGPIEFVFTSALQLPQSLMSKLGSQSADEIKPSVTSLGYISTPEFKLPTNAGLSKNLERAVMEEWAAICYEWSAMASLGSRQLQSSVDEFLSSYTVLDAAPSPLAVSRVTWQGGPIPSSWVVSSLWPKLQSVSANWWSLNVAGPEDIPVAWSQKEHTFLVSGENHYGIVHLNTKPETPSSYLCTKLVSGKDMYS